MNRIICGNAVDVVKSLDASSIHLIITSPPYNIGIEYDGYSDSLPEKEYLLWMKEVWAACHRVLVGGGRLCINFGENKRNAPSIPYFSAFIHQCVDIGYTYRDIIIWNKNTAHSHTAWGSWKSPSNPRIVPRHEYILVFNKNGYKLDGDKNNSDIGRDEFMECSRSVWNVGTTTQKRTGHPAAFPVEIALRLVKFYSYQGNTVLDPFAGSGTVGVACKSVNRNYILIDTSDKYCKIAENRIKEMGDIF